jgi:hypothetical protein
VALKPKHRRQIRDLMDVLLRDKAWQPHHTDSLMSVVREARSDVAEHVERMAASEYAASKREVLRLKNEQMRALREVDSFREALKNQHAKVAALLEALTDLPLAKALVRQEDGSYALDHSLIEEKDAKLALAAADKILKVSGAYAPIKQELTTAQSGNAFDVLDAVEAEEEA